jgi:hypothetical protein
MNLQPRHIGRRQMLGMVAPLLAITPILGQALAPALASETKHKSVLIEKVPHIKQKPDFCGEACAEMYLKKLGHRLDQNDVFDRSGLDPLLARGCYTRELNQALSRIGFKAGTVWYQVPTSKMKTGVQEQFSLMHADLAKGIPSIVCMHYDDQPKTTEHFRLILGFDARADEVIYHEPAAANGAYKRMKRGLFLKLWPLKYSATKWTVVRMRLDSSALKKPQVDKATKPDKRQFTDADYAQHIMELKKKLPGKQFTVLIERPFVVIGDESAATVRTRSIKTIRWAVSNLQKSYFDKNPDQILDVWLFKDKTSYDKHTKGIFKDDPGTPYGYYSRAHGALIMNIATGGGTLVHEIVHPYIEANFPKCPSWFNEGLGSLYEQCGERGGKIVGFTNWRLAGLQKAIRAGTVPSFKTLTATTSWQFYSKDRGTNYSQARYLLYYLQQKGLLGKYYKQFLADQKTDPTGYKTLQQVLGQKDMSAFQKQWQKYVLTLKYR